MTEYILIAGTDQPRPFVVAKYTDLARVADLMLLNEVDVRHALDTYGRCDTDTHTLIQVLP